MRKRENSRIICNTLISTVPVCKIEKMYKNDRNGTIGQTNVQYLHKIKWAYQFTLKQSALNFIESNNTMEFISSFEHEYEFI